MFFALTNTALTTTSDADTYMSRTSLGLRLDKDGILVCYYLSYLKAPSTSSVHLKSLIGLLQLKNGMYFGLDLEKGLTKAAMQLVGF